MNDVMQPPSAGPDVVTFYCFTPLADLPALQAWLADEAEARDLKGTILLAEEGINGTLSGTRTALEAFEAILRGIDGLSGMPFKYSSAAPENPVFYRLKVRIKAEIVALGQPDVDPGQRTGTHVDAVTWNALLDDPDVLVIDTRNGYEIAIGSFPGATDPDTTSFKQFPDYVAGLDPAAQPRVAMFCTGGIRCEKASAYMLQQGFPEVFQLDGGVLRYLETVSPEENRWQGECFVFDQRVSVGDSLTEGSYQQCFACRHPLTEAEVASDAFEQGVSCPYCIADLDEVRRDAFSERQRQVELAAARGDRHVGKRMPQSELGSDSAVDAPAGSASSSGSR